MAQPIPFKPPLRDPHAEILSRLQGAPAAHAEAILSAYEILQILHDRGVLDLLRGTLGAGDRLVEIAVEGARSPETISAIRNTLLLARALAAIKPELLADFTRALPEGLALASREKARPPGLFKLLGTFFNRDFRRGLAAFNDMLVAFGRNLGGKNPES
jgi:uncharacterized protein YjgD (DUF1641 family)